MEIQEIFEKLDIMENVKPFEKLLTLSALKKDEEKSVLDWFCKHGHLRCCFDCSGHSINIFSDNRIMLYIGRLDKEVIDEFKYFEENGKWIHENPEHNPNNGLKRNYSIIKYIWENIINKEIKYCTSYLFHTPEETVKDFQEDESYMFSNSRENKTSIKKHEIDAYKLLNEVKSLEKSLIH